VTVNSYFLYKYVMPYPLPSPSPSPPFPFPFTPPQASLEELMEGTSGATLTVYDEAALCSSAFKILRGMVHTWMNEASNYHNYYADLQLQHFYR
jgi:hypothetical protein